MQTLIHETDGFSLRLVVEDVAAVYETLKDKAMFIQDLQCEEQSGRQAFVILDCSGLILEFTGAA